MAAHPRPACWCPEDAPDGKTRVRPECTGRWPPMKIVEFYSHLNGWEHIKVHKKHIWAEIVRVIKGVDAEVCRTKVSKEERKAKQGLLYSPIALNKAFHDALRSVNGRRIASPIGLPLTQNSSVR